MIAGVFPAQLGLLTAGSSIDWGGSIANNSYDHHGVLFGGGSMTKNTGLDRASLANNDCI